MENKKMIATAQKIDVFFKILQVIIIGGLIGSCIIIAALTVVNWVNPDVVIGKGVNNVSLGPVSVLVTPEYALDNNGILVYSWIVLALGCIGGTATWFCLKYIRNILETMKQGSPFCHETVGNFKKLAWVVLIAGIVKNIVNFVAARAVVSQWHLAELPQIEGIQGVQMNVELEPGFILVFFGILLMSYIFEYGTSLQQLSDETL